ncbi:hypothetical protein V8C35DRAFT_286547 [Trichoderma chlorosporum]
MRRKDPVEEMIDLPYLEKIRRGVAEKYETIRDGRFRDEGWRERRYQQEGREAERAKTQPKDPIARQRHLTKEEPKCRQFERLLAVLDMDWPTEPSRAEFYFYPSTYDS